MGFLLGLVVALVPVIIAAAWLVAGVRRQWIGAAWLTAAGFALIPASYLTFVKACAQIGKTCPSPDTVQRYHQAAISLVLLVLAALVLVVRRRGGDGPPNATRRIMFAGLTFAAALWLADLLARDHQAAGAFVTALLPTIALGNEVARRLRQRRFDAGVRKLLTEPRSSV